MSSNYVFPEAGAHGKIEEIFPNIYTVKGEISMPLMITKMSFSRNMNIIRQGDDLILIHTIRLNEEGLNELDKLGKVKHIIRLAGFHGKDDPFYKDRYGAKVWAVNGATYFEGFEDKGKHYFTPDEEMDVNTKLPIEGAKLHIIESNPPRDCVLLVEHPEGKILFTGDSLQNYESTDEYYNWIGKVIMRMMGFIKPCNVGPAYAKKLKVQKSEMENVLALKFDHLMPSHGVPCIGNAWEKCEPAVQKMN